ncbi:unnamed protein product, partial [Ixodes pacificus]
MDNSSPYVSKGGQDMSENALLQDADFRATWHFLLSTWLVRAHVSAVGHIGITCN